MAQLIEEFRPLEFWRFDGLSHEHICRLIKYHELLARKPGLPPARADEFSRNSAELLSIFSKVLQGARSGTMHPKRFQGRVTALEMHLSPERTVKIESLAPMGRRVEIYEGAVFDCIDGSGRLGKTLPDSSHNLISLVLLITFGETRILLGGDLEGQCWVEVMGHVSDLHASLVKVCHHGSTNGHCEGLWYQFAARDTRKPLAVLTPYHRFNLPEEEAVREIKAHSQILYSTCSVSSSPQPSSAPPIDSRATTRATFRSRRVDPINQCGRCSFRFNADGEYSVELQPPAYEVS
jgi:hypothetical protein